MKRLPLNRSSRFARPVAAAILLLFIAISACAAVRNDLIAHASEDTLWLAQVRQSTDPHNGEYTTLRYRSLNTGDPLWRELPRVNGRVVQMTHRGGTLAVMLS